MALVPPLPLVLSLIWMAFPCYTEMSAHCCPLLPTVAHCPVSYNSLMHVIIYSIKLWNYSRSFGGFPLCNGAMMLASRHHTHSLSPFLRVIILINVTWSCSDPGLSWCPHSRVPSNFWIVSALRMTIVRRSASVFSLVTAAYSRETLAW